MTAPKLSLENVVKAFGPKKVLNGVSLDVAPGRSLVIIGGSGVGKSVTIKCAIGLLRPDSGVVRVDGEDVTRASGARLSEIRAKFGMLFQGAALFDSLTIWENVAFRLLYADRVSRQDARERAIETMRKVRLAPETANLRPVELSGGMQKRAGLARAIITKPDLIFFDEPTTGLDPITADAINELIVEMVKDLGCAAVPVHDPETRRIRGVIDSTGDERAVDPHALPLMEATAAAAEAELLVMRLRQRAAAADASSAPVSIPLGSPASRGASAARGVAARAQARARAGARSRARTTRTSAVLHVLGRDTGDLELPDGGSLELSARHAEIVTLLAWRREGLAADLLTDLVYGENGSSVTRRAEIVRLRRALEPAGIELASRPYRLGGVVELDLHRVVSLLDRGAHRVALAGYGGGPLPGSDAPGILEIRADVGVRMREALLAAASPDVLLAYAATREGADDVDVLRELLRVLPPRSPRRAALVARLEQLERSER